MTVYEYGAPETRTVLIQPVGEHHPGEIDSELAAIRKLSGAEFRLLAVKVDRWNHDLSPWSAPAVFRNEAFGDGAAATLAELVELCRDKRRTYFIGGYSLAGLFSLWAACQTDAFRGVAAVSPSAWFPGFADYMRSNQIRSNAVYLSLGDREENVRHPVLSTVGDCIRDAYALMKDRGIRCTLEWNPGNHFQAPDLRTAKGFAWLLNTEASS